MCTCTSLPFCVAGQGQGELATWLYCGKEGVKYKVDLRRRVSFSSSVHSGWSPVLSRCHSFSPSRLQFSSVASQTSLALDFLFRGFSSKHLFLSHYSAFPAVIQAYLSGTMNNLWTHLGNGMRGARKPTRIGHCHRDTTQSAERS
jgi:hypothetical protein